MHRWKPSKYWDLTIRPCVTWQNVEKFTSDCRQNRNYRWIVDEEITNSYIKNYNTIVKTVGKYCFKIMCDYNMLQQWEKYVYGQVHYGYMKGTCTYDRYTDEKKKCYGFKPVYGTGCL